MEYLRKVPGLPHWRFSAPAGVREALALSKPQTKDRREKIIDMLFQSSLDNLPCIHCAASTHERGLWQVDKTGMLGVREDQYRIAVYPVCWRHPLSADTAKACEAYIVEHAWKMILEDEGCGPHARRILN